MQLSKTEEQLMAYLWQLESALMKELIIEYDDPKPAATTIATLLKRMSDKGFVSYETEGRSRRYFPLVKKDDYVTGRAQGLVKSFFGDSSSQFASFFTKSTDFTKEELEELKSIIDEQIEKKK
ncbi:BlaI/MecI/CopY family transcriptional regulator [Saprospiraceae bacterium]|nr:BlaI/MecI/CopY family transcriptional regulator [Saprospiraceae bacterium]